MLNYRPRAGSMLENYLNSICDYINSAGGHAHKNHPQRSFRGDYISGEPFDYEIFAGDKVYCFDAKENFSGGIRWRIKLTGSRGKDSNSRILKQARNLTQCKYNGAAEAFFLVAFDNKKNKLPFNLVKYDAEFVYNAIISGARYLEFNEGSKFNIEEIVQSIRKG